MVCHPPSVAGTGRESSEQAGDMGKNLLPSRDFIRILKEAMGAGVI